MFGRNKNVDKPSDQSETAPGAKDVFSEGNDWEARHVYNLEAGARRAYKFATGALFAAVLPWIGIVAMLPLKEVVPYVVKENAQGESTILTRVNWEELSYDEARDKHWAARYVIARERYDWYALQEDYDLVLMLSSGDVGKEYNALYQGDSARDTKLSNRTRVKVRILSVVPSGTGSATVRYQTETGSPDGADKAQFNTYVATVAYTYSNNTAMPEKERLQNPFGFVVTSYRNDTEQFPGSGR